MANKNPIRAGEDGPFEEFKIPKKYSDSVLTLTIHVSLTVEGWQRDEFHSINLGGADIYDDERNEPDGLPLGKGASLNGKKLCITSRVDRIRDGAADEEASPVKYELLIKAGDKPVDGFDCESGTQNPVKFYSNIKFLQL